MSKRKTAATKTTVARASGRRNEPKSQISSDGSGREYRAEGTDQEESADESTEWSRNDMEGSVTEEEAETAGGGRGGQRDQTATVQVSTGSRAGPLSGSTAAGGVTPGLSPLRPRMRREREAAMGRNQGKGRGFPAGRKTWNASPQEWGSVRGAARPQEWRKTLGGGLPGSGRGSRVAKGHHHPLVE